MSTTDGKKRITKKMNLEFENLAEWGKLHRKIKNQRHQWFWTKPSKDEVESWRLQMFTVDKKAQEESEQNLGKILDVASQAEAPYVVLKPDMLQFVGTENSLAHTVLASEEWMDQYRQFCEKNSHFYFSKPFWTHAESDQGLHTFTLYAYGLDALFARSPQTGFYDTKAGKKITDRKQQITTLWDLGWAARRGRPVSVGNERHSGSTSEIQLITKLASDMWHRRGQSDVADRIISTYTSTNRYYAWPGSW